MKAVVNPDRYRKLNRFSYSGGPVVYWMSRDQRVSDNWALILAGELAERFETSLAVVFCLAPRFLGATLRQYDFMLKGMAEVDSGLRKFNIPLFLLDGDPVEVLSSFIRKTKAGALVTDFSPLKIKQNWNAAVLKKIAIPFYEVDAHNIVPCWMTSVKQEYAAYTIRPKINRLLDFYLHEFPQLKKQSSSIPIKPGQIDWTRANRRLKVDRSVGPVDWCDPGYRSGISVLRRFIRDKLIHYAEKRNDPAANFQSGLSPYLHFGQISPQRVALEISAADVAKNSKNAFLEELIIRRELADNFCYYNGNYDSIKGFPSWASDTLWKHRKDPRKYLYSKKQLEDALTHDDLWNAAQRQMVINGTMHGYLRMYWAKKILEWSKNHEEALAVAIEQNDRYQLDGRDPNGYAGIAWSVGGVHDRPWKERAIFGKVRYMSYDGCRRKFNIEEYIRSIE